MIVTKKYRHKPVYKKFLTLKSNVQNKQKLLKFKKRKWKILIFQLTKTSKFKKRNCYYKFYDQRAYTISKYNNFFSKNFKKNITEKKKFNLSYSSLSKNYLKTLVSKSTKKSNQIKNKLNEKKIFMSLLEKRLDVILLRSHFVLSIRNARQLILHRHVLINNKIVTNSSVLLNQGDVITFSKKSHKIIRYFLILSDIWPLPPKYLQISYKLFYIKVVDNILLSNFMSQQLIWLNLNNVLNTYKN